MKIVAAPDNIVDRLDRALWLTGPFDIAWSAPATGGMPLVSAITRRRVRRPRRAGSRTYYSSSLAWLFAGAPTAHVANGAAALRLWYGGAELKHLTTVGALPGTIVRAVAARNAPGYGRLRIAAQSHKLSWCAPGSATFGTPLAVPDQAYYVLFDGTDANKWIEVEVYPTYLPSNGQEALVYLNDRYNNPVAQADLTAAEAMAGDELIYQLTIKNIGVMDMLDLRAWLAAAASSLELSTDGVTWYAPTTEGTATVVSWARLASGTETTLHVRRTIGAAADYNPDILNLLHFAWNGF